MISPPKRGNKMKFKEPLRNESSTNGVQLNKHEYATNHIQDLAENGNRWLAFHNLNLVKRYIEGEIYVVIDFNVLGLKTPYQFLFSAIPHRGPYNMKSRGCRHCALDLTKEDAHRRKHPVLICVAYPVQCPEKVVPSFVWLDRAKKRPDLLGEIFTFAFKSSLKVRSIFPEREMSVLRVRGAGGAGDNKTSLVKGRSKIVDCICGDNGQFVRDRSSKFDFIKLVNSIRIGFSNVGIGLCLEESLRSLVKINDVIFAPCPTQP
jgi:hypothetical protein